MDTDTLLSAASALRSQQQHIYLLTLFVTILKRLWQHILYETSASVHALSHFKLTPIVNFLLLVLQPLAVSLSMEILHTLWQSLHWHIPTWTGPLLEPEVDDLFREYGPHCELGAEMLYPPYRECACSGECHGTVLDNEVRVFCRIYTSVEVFCRRMRYLCTVAVSSSQCFNYTETQPLSECHTRYHYSYSVKDPSMPSAVREYYAEFLPYAQAQQKVFAEVDLCEYFENYMCLSQYVTRSPKGAPLRP